MTEAADLCAAGLAVIGRRGQWLPGIWPRAASLLVRRGLELSLADLWKMRTAEDAAEALPTMRTQLICLPTLLGDPELAGQVSFTWWALTRACHRGHYDLPPTAAELTAAVVVVRRLDARVTAIGARRGGDGRSVGRADQRDEAVVGGEEAPGQAEGHHAGGGRG